MSWLRRVPAPEEPHGCNTPSWSDRADFGIGSLWQCDACPRVHRLEDLSDSRFWVAYHLGPKECHRCRADACGCWCHRLGGRR